MSVVDDLLDQLASETRKAAREVVTGRPSQASCDGGGAKSSTPEALEAPGTVGTGSDAVKCPVLFTQAPRCDDCPWTCCEVDGTCWKVERAERDRLAATGEYDSARAVHMAPWSKRAIRHAEEQAVAALSEQERRREAREEQIKAERAAERTKRKGHPEKLKKLPPTEALAAIPVGRRTSDAKLADARENGAKARKKNRGTRPGIMGQPPKMTVAQVEAAVEEQQFRSIRAIANERWQEWGYASPAAAYQGVRGQIQRLGLPLLDGRRFAEGPRARDNKKEAA